MTGKQLDLESYGLEEKDDGSIVSRSFGESLKAEDVGKPGDAAEATILEVQEKIFDPVEGPKLILLLAVPKVGAEPRRLALNKTNLLTLVNERGRDLTAWVNAELTLRVERTTFNGKQVPCIRVYKA